MTGEFEILSWLFHHGPTRSRELSICTKVSIANFQIILRRLKDEGLVVSYSDEKDRRVRLFDLAEHVRRDFEEWVEAFAMPALLLGRSNVQSGGADGSGSRQMDGSKRGH